MYSRIKYEIKIYENCSFNSIDKMQVVQNKLLKLVSGKDKMTPTDECYKCMNILKVENTYEWNALPFVNDIMTRKHAYIFWTIFSKKAKAYNVRRKDHMVVPFIKLVWERKSCSGDGCFNVEWFT